MKLIRELFEDVEYITEASEDGKKKLYIEGVYLQSAIKNKNGRIYPESVMDKEVSRYLKEEVERGSAFGELMHPTSPTVDLNNVSHRIVSLVKEGTNYIGKSIIMDTPKGNTVRGIIECGGKLGVSSRALGTIKVNSQGINEVQGDFRLSTAADIVQNPSAPEAWVEGIMENVEWFYDEKQGWKALEKLQEAKAEVHSTYSTMSAERKLQLFEAYLNSL